MDLTILIVTHNGENYLHQCINSIYQTTTDICFEVIVVDNASSDGTAALVKNKFPQVTLIQNEQNLGFAKANNQAIKQAKGRYVVILNQDVVILDNALGKMVSFLDHYPETGAVGCKIYTSLAKTDIQISAFKRFPTPGIVFLHTLINGRFKKIFSGSKMVKMLSDKYLMHCASHNFQQEVEHLIGAIIMTRQDIISQVGLLDERFFMYLEETDWCYRIRKKGWKIYFLPDAEIVHFYDPKRSSKGMQKKIRQQSYLKYLSKHHSLFSLVLFKYFYTALSLKDKISGLLGNRNTLQEN